MEIKQAGASGGLSGFVSLNTRAIILRCTITCSHCVLNRQIDAYPAYGRHRVGGISLTKMALSRVVDFPYHCTFSVTPAIARCFVMIDFGNCSLGTMVAYTPITKDYSLASYAHHLKTS